MTGLTLHINLSIQSSNMRLSVGSSRGSRKHGFESAPEPYHAVRNDEKELLYGTGTTFVKSSLKIKL